MGSQNGLVRTIEIKDKQGRVVETKEVVTYAGLLNRAHEEGLKSIRTRLVQTPSADNDMTAISLAEVVTEKGVFRDYGDANPNNVNGRIIPHIIRMSITRAKARALRDAINVGVISMEELGQEYTNGNGGRTPHGAAPPGQSSSTRATGDAHRPITENQRKYLFRLFEERGVNAEAGHDWLCTTCSVKTVKHITRAQASEVIDQLVSDPSAPHLTPTT